MHKSYKWIIAAPEIPNGCVYEAGKHCNPSAQMLSQQRLINTWFQGEEAIPDVQQKPKYCHI